ncbi:MAG: NAD(P)H-dependent glycerol-3-phosphate dehydrogenase [Gemmatimonadales bacterium]|nr:NAD(P)H-dependent glycerol-3-phosphate dehydrogenase [Gemmatimonadales bacterium]
MSRVAVLGAGAWGTSLADLLARKGLEVRIWAHESEVADAINREHCNPVYFGAAALDPRLTASTDLTHVLDGAPVICSVAPSHVTRALFQRAAPLVREGTQLVCATKGIEPESLSLMSDVAAEVLPQAAFIALSGPSFADEVHQGQPTAVVAASGDAAAREAVQQLFSTPYFRVYTGSDVVGVELAGSLKNTIAIAAGILEGLGMGNNPRAALLTRGLAEIARLGAALGAHPETFAGLAGMGDLILTCTGALSRNRQLGTLLAQGTTLEAYRASHRNVAEGVNTALGASRLAARHGVAMPITEQVAAVLFQGASPREAVRQLMERELKAERWT